MFSLRNSAALRGVHSSIKAGLAAHPARDLTAAGSAELRAPAALPAASIIINCAGAALPIAVLEIYDAVIPAQAHATLWALAFAVLCALGVELILRVARARVATSAAARFEAAASAWSVERVVAQTPAAGETRGRRLASLRAASRLAEFYQSQLVWTRFDWPFALLYLLLISLIGGWMAAALLLILATFIAQHARNERGMQLALVKRDEEDAKIQDFIAESLGSIQPIKAQALESELERRMERLLGAARDAKAELIFRASQGEGHASLLGQAAFLSLALTGGALFFSQGLTSGAIAACMLLANRMIQIVLRATGAMQAAASLEAAKRDLEGLARVEGVIPPETSTEGPLRSLRAPLRFRQGEFELHIEFGETLALEAEDRAWRSQVLRALAGEVELPGMEASYAGAPAALWRAMHPRSLVLIDSRSSVLVGSIRDNLTLFGQGADWKRALAAAELTGLGALAARLPQGYETLIGEAHRAGRHSALDQLVVLSRAIALRPRVLLLEEPQAFLDARADASVLDTLRRLRGTATLVIASDRPSYRALATRTIALPRPALAQGAA